MKQCINCLSSNIKTVAIKDRLFYYCTDCEFKSERVINNDGDVYTRKENGMIKHITVAAVIIKNNKLLMLDRKRFPFGLSLPTGHLLNNENIGHALSRTILNKTGLTIADKKLVLNDSILDSCKYWGEVHEWFVYDCETTGNTSVGEDKIVWIDVNSLQNEKIVESSQEILESLFLIKKKQKSTVVVKNNPTNHTASVITHEMEGSIIETLPFAIMATDLEANVIFENKSASVLMNKFKKSKTKAQDLKFYNVTLKDLVSRAIKSNFTVSSNVKIGSETFNIVVKPINVKNRIIGTSVTLNNVTDQRQKEARDVLAYRTSLAVCSNSNYLSIIKTVLKQMFYSMDIVGSSLMTLEGDTLKVTFRYSKIDHKRRAPLTLKLGEGVAGWVAKNKTILAIPDTSKDPLYVGSAIKEEKSILSVPVMYDGEVYGVLNISKKSNEFFSEEEIKMVEIVANRIALAFENEKLHRQTIQEKNILEQVLTNTTDGIALVDNRLEVIISNTYFKKLYGLRESSNLQTLKDLMESLSKEDHKTLKERIHLSISSKHTEVIEICSHYNSKPHYLKVTISPFIEKESRCDKVLVVVNDISDQKEKQGLIERQFEQISALFEISSTTSKNVISISQYVETFGKIERISERMLGSEVKIILFDSNNSSKGQFLKEFIVKNNYDQGYISNNLEAELDKTINHRIKINNIVIAPIKEGSNIFGIIYAFNRETPYTQRDLSWLKSVATRMSLKILSLRLLEQSKYENEKLSRILDNTGDGIVVMSETQGEIKQLVWNKAMTKISGYKDQEDYFNHNPNKRALHSQYFYEAKKKGFPDSHNEVEMQTKNGDRIWLGVRTTFLTVENNIYGISVVRDISRKKQIETQQKEFVYTATHELRTPLTIINGYLSMILGGDAGEINEKQSLYFSRVKTATERIINLVEELLKVARLEENRVEFERKPFDGAKIFEEIKQEFEEKAKTKKLSFVVNPKVIEKHIQFLGDFHKTKEAISNIVDNAIKYTKKGSVEVDFTENNEYGTIIISDTGVGIHPKDQTNVFKKFIRIANSESVKAGGTGLGLYIVKNLIEQQGGHIRLESNLGEGTKFFVDLPKAHIRTQSKS